jgi:hypothetical protein
MIYEDLDKVAIEEVNMCLVKSVTGWFDRLHAHDRCMKAIWYATFFTTVLVVKTRPNSWLLSFLGFPDVEAHLGRLLWSVDIDYGDSL